MLKYSYNVNGRVDKLREALKKRRENLGLTQAQVAEIASIPQSTYKLIELGRRNPTLTTAKKISDALHVSLDIFLLDEESASKIS